MMNQQDLESFCNESNYDLRNSGNGRWIDQKCTPDVVSIVADCIVNYSKNDGLFTTKDIWNSDYAIENVKAIFTKPDVQNKSARHEYDKFFQQPMEMLAYAGVLKKEKRGNRNYYSIQNGEILEYIAMRERNAIYFLKVYIEHVLKDSGIWGLFSDFINTQTKASYSAMKKGYTEFIINNTRINGNVECYRIFTKVLNPLAFCYHVNGTERGKMSEHPISLDMLMYNRYNFRDNYRDKPKGVTRKEYDATHPIEVNEAFYKYQSAKAKRILKAYNLKFRDGKTEYVDGKHSEDRAIHIHHIFPEADYPDICFYYENLIALTPTQHLGYAHPNGKTTEIDENYQYHLLVSKAHRIKENLTSRKEDHIYDFSNFLYVLHVGFDNDDVLEIADMDFDAVFNSINAHYA